MYRYTKFGMASNSLIEKPYNPRVKSFFVDVLFCHTLPLNSATF